MLIAKLADKTKDRAAIHRDLNKGKKWVEKDHMKFNKGKCGVQYLGRNHPIHQHILGDVQMENNLAEKDWGSSWTPKFNMNQ